MKIIYAVLLVCLSHLAATVGASAQHPVNVQRLSAEGEHLKALTMYEVLPERVLAADTRLAAARSAWALGLNDRAAREFDTVLRLPDINADLRARLTLSRGVLEFQEERYQEAVLYATKAVSYLKEPSPLRGRAYLLWGQSLSALKSYAVAEDKFLKALHECEGVDAPEVNFSLGIIEMKLAKYNDAEERLKKVPSDHDRAAEALRALASIALETGRDVQAKFWIEKGKLDHPDAFVDSWADYGLVQVALSQNDLLRARRKVEDAQQQYPPSDAWLILMQAALEKAEWERHELIGGDGK
jgi:tetratricopeptide (TPR) repeat protein